MRQPLKLLVRISLLALTGVIALGAAFAARLPDGRAQPVIKWEFQASDKIYAVAVSPSGVIYVGSGYGNSGQVDALGPFGALQWSYPAFWVQSLAALPDGGTAVGAEDGNIFALSSGGRRRWKYQASNAITSVAAEPGGHIYAGSWNHSLYALDLNGNLLWTYQAPDAVTAVATASGGKRVYAGCNDNNVYALDANGKILWSFAAKDSISSVAEAPDGGVIAGSWDKGVYALDASGRLRWVYQTGGLVRSVAAAGDGSVYAGADDANIYALSHRGRLLWAWRTGDTVLSVAVGKEGAVYAASEDKTLYAIDANGDFKWMFSGAAAYLASKNLGSGSFSRAERRGEFPWDASHAISIPKRLWRGLRGGPYNHPPRGFDLVGFLASQGLEQEFRGLSGQPPTPPQLVQGPYESRVAFQERVAVARRKLALAIQAYRERFERAKVRTARDATKWLVKAFDFVFGTPRVLGTPAYDPDRMSFTLAVGPSGDDGLHQLLAGGASFYLLLQDHVPPAKAPDIQARLARGRPRLRFAISNDKFVVTSAEIRTGHWWWFRDWRALPAALGQDNRPAEVNLADVVAKADISNLHVSLSPLSSQGELLPDVEEPGFKRRKNPDAYAVVIGIENYQQELPAAVFADRDARAVRRYLRALGYADRHIHALTEDQATYSAIQKNIEGWLPSHTNDASTVFVYYAGHGAPDPGSGDAYILPWDGDPQYLRNTAYPLKRLSRSLSRLRARNVIVALDACFSGAGGRSVAARGRAVLVKIDPGFWTARDMGVMTAAKADQIAEPLAAAGHGLFTYYMLRGLKKRGGRSTLLELYDYLKAPVEDAAMRDDNRPQTPQLFGKDTGVTLSGRQPRTTR